ncbi:MAG: HAMP domain-containing histidine kinase, partial [Deltaproteobacteria bacterium]|nr:HAMP domain-containing histidine kinase [Deltaproteobacteria bacterium]
ERGKGVVAMINELLNLERLRSGLYPPRKTKHHFGSVVGKALEVVQGKADEKKIRISVEGLDSLPQIYADPEEMEEVVVNLAGNSVKYTPYGGEILIRAEAERDILNFSIRDNGIGIPEKEMPMLFTEFFRASNAKMMEKEGTGLGLMIVKQIVETYGGVIKVESLEGKGTTIRIFMPVIE